MKDDLISKTAAIDAVEEIPWYHQNKNGEMVQGANSREHQAWYKADDIYHALYTLPPAQLAQDLPNGCTDTISRQAAIQTAERMYRRCDTSSIEDYHDLMVDALTELPPAQPRWIPCSRELPKPNEEDGNGFHKAYLVQDGRWMDVARWDGKYWIAWGYSTVLLNVVAWMPLPTSYREGGQDGET